MPRSGDTVSPSRSAVTSTCRPSALGTHAYSGAMVRTVLLWNRRVWRRVFRSYSDDRRWRPSPVAAMSSVFVTNRGETSCWISRVTRVSFDPSRLTTKISQSSFGIAWNAMREPSGDTASAPMRSRVFLTADAGPPGGPAMTLVSSALRARYASVEPSADSAGDEPVTTVDAPVLRSSTTNDPDCPRPPPRPAPPPGPPRPPPPRPPPAGVAPSAAAAGLANGFALSRPVEQIRRPADRRRCQPCSRAPSSPPPGGRSRRPHRRCRSATGRPRGRRSRR